MSLRPRCLRSLLASSALLVVPLHGLAQDAKLHGALPAELARAEATELVPVVIVLAEQLSEPERFAARAIDDKNARRAEVVAQLRERSELSQAPLLAQLADERAAGRAAKVRSLWIANVVAAELAPELVLAIAARSDVDHVALDRPAGAEVWATAPAAGGVNECGVDLMGADEVWAQHGIVGRGVIVGVIDTGTCLIHPDIAGQIWRNPLEIANNQVDDDGNGFVDDLNGWNFGDGDNKLFDPHGHGSHVAGTVAGDGSAGNQCGMAPGCDVMTLKLHASAITQSSVWDAMQYGTQHGAHVLSGSLGWHHGSNPDRATWRMVCDNAIAAGVIVVYAAHNWGCGNPPDNVTTPGDVPDVITVGATDCNDVKAGFSSCGPVEWANVSPYNDHPYPPGLVKPTIAAPGVDTLSHNKCSGYTNLSGTSMSTPHVSGGIALLLEADPTLDQFGVTNLLRATAIDLGAPGIDNEFGSGRVDILAAVEQALTHGNHCAPKQNSCGGLPQISASGQPSASASNGFLVTGSLAKTGSVGVLAYTNQGAALPPLPFWGGQLCLKTPLRRGPVTPAIGGSGACDAQYSLDLNAFAAGMAGGNPAPYLLVPGTSVHCQWWGRDTLAHGPYLTAALGYFVYP